MSKAEIKNDVNEKLALNLRKANEAEIIIRGKDAKRVCDLLERIAYFGEGPWKREEQTFAKMIVDELRNKIKEI